MRYIGLLTGNQGCQAGLFSRPALMERVGKLMEESMEAGVLAASSGLEPNLQGARVKLSAGEFTVSDDRFTETKEPGASYAMFDVESIDEAIQWTKCFLLVLGAGECEIRPLFETSEGAWAA
jgi:hypothetical protein